MTESALDARVNGLTKGGRPWRPEFIESLDPTRCIGCGRCYKVCPRDVFSLVERSELLADDDDDWDDDDEMMVMTVADADDCIGCTACAKVCPKNCQTHTMFA